MVSAKSIKQSKIVKNELKRHGVRVERLKDNNKDYGYQLLFVSIVQTEDRLNKILSDYERRIKKNIEHRGY